MSSALELYVLFIVVGLLLIGIEVFIPGGIVGLFGALALMAAVVTGFFAFGAENGFLSAISIIILGGSLLLLWLKVFPKTSVGKRLTLATDGKFFKSSTEENKNLIGVEGLAVSALRPAGIASFNGHRVDVVSESGYIECGSRIKVIQSEGNRIVVRASK